MKRRQKVAEARAERVFADLARGVKFEELTINKARTGPVEVSEYLEILTFVDFTLPQRVVLDVFLLPVLGSSENVSGLIVRPKVGRNGRYERVGMFSGSWEKQLVKLPFPDEPESFLLV